MPKTDKLVIGLALTYNNEPWVVIGTHFENPGKGQAFTKAKMRNLKTGKTLVNTFKSGESVEILDTVRKKAQYLYEAAGDYHFMDNDNYEQFSLHADAIEDNKKYLTEGAEVHVLYIEGNPISIQLPAKMTFKVIQAPPGERGDTATGGNKDVEIETGAMVKVPLFIKEGQEIIVNTESGEYVSKA
jgi:elongation factor P